MKFRLTCDGKKSSNTIRSETINDVSSRKVYVDLARSSVGLNRLSILV